jgi:cysteinyl-tRNA synthetase
MEIKLFNGLTDRVETFKPITPGQVTMYVCGPTVYDFVHIGNLRPLVVFDVLKKLLIALGYHVKHVSNYTDIDDRIIEKALKENTDELTISKRFIKAYQDDVIAMNALLPDFTPTVTEHLPAMIAFIQTLIDQGFAYRTNLGDVFFRINRIKNYGQLSHMDLESMKVGARVETNTDKENPLDFALWKHTTNGIKFSAPFGEGRPGWHTECVVMIQETFQQHLIDIHGGGFDLKFPHHENEIAQAQAAYKTNLANYWLHNGFINLNEEKMSKSTGNIFLAKDFIKQYGGPLLRYLLLSTHYRMPVNLTQLIIDNAQNELSKLHLTWRQLTTYLPLQNQDIFLKKTVLIDTFLQALSEDINTANALTILHQQFKEVNLALRNKQTEVGTLLNRFFTIKAMLDILGLDLNFTILSTEDRRLYHEYLAAKQSQDFSRSDAIRKILNDRTIFF